MDFHKQTLSGDIKVTIEKSKSDFSSIEGHFIVVKIENINVKSTGVNHRQVVNYPTCPKGMGDFLLIVKGPEAYINLRRKHVNPRRRAEKDWKQLKPGEILTKKVQTDKFYSLDDSGTYQVQVGFDNRNYLQADTEECILTYSNVLSIKIN